MTEEDKKVKCRFCEKKVKFEDSLITMQCNREVHVCSAKCMSDFHNPRKGKGDSTEEHF